MNCHTIIIFPKHPLFLITGGAGFIGSNLTEEYRGISGKSELRVCRGGYPRCGALHARVRGRGLCAASGGGGECS